MYESDYIVPSVSDGYTSEIINTYSFVDIWLNFGVEIFWFDCTTKSLKSSRSVLQKKEVQKCEDVLNFMRSIVRIIRS